jgi:ribose-phosphate pyrophosphokinase
MIGRTAHAAGPAGDAANVGAKHRERNGTMGTTGPMLFALGASAAFGKGIADALGSALAAHEERVFEDGEHKSRPLVSVRGRDVYVIHSLYADVAQSGNDKLMRLLFFVGALKDAGAARVTAVVPYLAYARKDRKSKPRDPVTTRYVAQLFEAVGTDCIVTLDVHNLAAYQNAFRTCRSEHLEAQGLFVAHFARVLGGRPVTVVSPDAGGIKRAEAFRQRLASTLGRPVGTAFAEKYRSSGTVSGDALVGDVAGRDAIILDDLISGGTTVARTASSCMERGARAVYAAATHGLFAGTANETLGTASVEQVVVTDSVPPLRVTDAALAAKLVSVSVVPLVAEAVRCLHEGGSLAALLER